MAAWTYHHRSLGEALYPDGTEVTRPVVPVLTAPGESQLLGVLDTGSPTSVANARLFAQLGVDVDNDTPLLEVPLGIGGVYAAVPVFEVELWLHPPESVSEPVAWRLPLAARKGWRLSFPILFGQRGWFDRFPTRIDGTTSTVEV
ncbi:MAG TPA: hypothetical protein VNQ73_20750 [Ilumatobacter sp.]|nr:hypothetical protein [Ilumatobacter sp.]